MASEATKMATRGNIHIDTRVIEVAELSQGRSFSHLPTEFVSIKIGLACLALPQVKDWSNFQVLGEGKEGQV